MSLDESRLVSYQTLQAIQNAKQAQQPQGWFNYTLRMFYGRTVVPDHQKEQILQDINKACEAVGLQERKIEVLPDGEDWLNKNPIYLCVQLEEMISDLALGQGSADDFQEFIYNEILNTSNSASVEFSADEKLKILTYMYQEVVCKKEWPADSPPVGDHVLQTIDLAQSEVERVQKEANHQRLPAVNVALPSLPNDNPLSDEQQELLGLMMEAPDKYGCAELSEYACKFLIKAGYVHKDNLIDQVDNAMREFKNLWDDEVKRFQSARDQISAPVQAVPHEEKHQPEPDGGDDWKNFNTANFPQKNFTDPEPPAFDRTFFVGQFALFNLEQRMSAPPGMKRLECTHKFLPLLEQLYPILHRELELSPEEMVACVKAGVIRFEDMDAMLGDLDNENTKPVVDHFVNNQSCQDISRNIRLAASRKRVQDIFQQYEPSFEILKTPGNSQSACHAIAMQLGIETGRAQDLLAGYIDRFKKREGDCALDPYVKSDSCVNLYEVDPNQVATLSDVSCHPASRPTPSWLPVMARCYSKPIICQVLQANGVFDTYSVSADGIWCPVSDIPYDPEARPIQLVYDVSNGHFDGYQDRNNPVVNTQPAFTPPPQQQPSVVPAKQVAPSSLPGVRPGVSSPPFTIPVPAAQVGSETVDGNEAQNELLYNGLAKEGLVNNWNEFQRLFSKIPQGIYLQGELTWALRYFRDLQSYQPETGIEFYDEMFSALVFQDQLKTPPWQKAEVPEDVVREAIAHAKRHNKTQAQIDDEMRQLETVYSGGSKKNICENLQGIAQKLDNYLPTAIGTEKVKARGMAPFQPGMLNFSNNCFMASSMQLSAHMRRNGTMLSELKRTVPAGVLVDYLLKYHMRMPPKGGLSDVEHAKVSDAFVASVWDEAYKLQANLNQAVTNDNPKGIQDFVFAHRRLTHAFVEMCEQINSQQGDQRKLVQAQVEFFTLLKQFGDSYDKPAIQDLIGGDPGQKHTLSQIKQEDAGEMIRVLATLTGSDADPRSTVSMGKVMSLWAHGTKKDEKVEKAVPESLLAFQLAGDTLDNCIQALISHEMLEPEEEKRVACRQVKSFESDAMGT